jgi:c-di-GMP-binding flagellar brake protein YcgR
LVDQKIGELNLFWKKKSNKPKSLIKSTAEVRGAFRVQPLPKQPIAFLFSGKRVNAMDISAGGISFKNNGFLDGKTENIKFKLPGDPRVLEVKLQIVRIIKEKNICCCQFVDMQPDEDDQVARYVLERQKYDLRMQKKGLLK